jgi:hypothetical protein
MAIRSHETRKEENVEKMEPQSSSFEKLGHSQKWMKKNKKPEHNGNHGWHIVYLKKSCVHTQYVCGEVTYMQ